MRNLDALSPICYKLYPAIYHLQALAVASYSRTYAITKAMRSWYEASTCMPQVTDTCVKSAVMHVSTCTYSCKVSLYFGNHIMFATICGQVANCTVNNFQQALL